MKPSNINFKNIADALGLDEQQAIVSLSVPPVIEGTLHYRAFCIAELLLLACDRPEPLHTQYAEVKRIVSHSAVETIVLIQFNGLPQFFPLALPNKYLSGHRDAIVMNLRKIERNLFYLLKAWYRVTLGGNKQFSHVQDLLDLIKENLKSKSYS